MRVACRGSRRCSVGEGSRKPSSPSSRRRLFVEPRPGGSDVTVCQRRARDEGLRGCAARVSSITSVGTPWRGFARSCVCAANALKIRRGITRTFQKSKEVMDMHTPLVHCPICRKWVGTAGAARLEGNGAFTRAEYPVRPIFSVTRVANVLRSSSKARI